MFDSPVLPMIALCAAVFGIFYMRISTQHRQRMAMIEKGLTAPEPRPVKRTSTAYALGLVFLGVGAGLGIGWFVDTVLHGSEAGNNPLPYFISVFICGGLALIHYHRTVERIKN
ncbi:MAG: hypothetical protein JNM62_14955 [Flavobacteriales bacterium]|nr:hypothetical protein [Flavobacteriales bacterium]